MCAWYAVSVAPALAPGAGLPTADRPGSWDESPCEGPPPAGPPLTKAVAGAPTVGAVAGAAWTGPGTSAPPRAGVLAAVGTGLPAAGTGLAGAGTGLPGSGDEVAGAETGLAALGDGAAGARPACPDPIAGPIDARPVALCVAPPGVAGLPAETPVRLDAVGAWLSAAGGRLGAAAGSVGAVGTWLGTAVAPSDRAAWDADPATTPCCAPGMLLPPAWAVATRPLCGAPATPDRPAAACVPRPWCCRPGIIALPRWLAVGAATVGTITCGLCVRSGLEFAG